jgi:hypothetical protein
MPALEPFGEPCPVRSGRAIPYVLEKHEGGTMSSIRSRSVLRVEQGRCMPCRVRPAVAAAALVLALGGPSASAEVFTVGGGASCTHATLAAAIAAAQGNGTGQCDRGTLLARMSLARTTSVA